MKTLITILSIALSTQAFAEWGELLNQADGLGYNPTLTAPSRGTPTMDTGTNPYNTWLQNQRKCQVIIVTDAYGNPKAVQVCN